MFKKLFSRFRPTIGEPHDAHGLYFYLTCARCGAPVMIRADKRHDLQRDYENGGFLLRKEVMDSRCFTPFFVNVRLDASYHIIEQESEGGNFITWAEYKKLTGLEPESSGASQRPTMEV